MIDLFGHLSYAAVMVGLILLARQNNYGWIVKLVGDLGWVGLGIAMGMSSIIVWGSLFVILDIAGWEKWRQIDAADLALVKERLAEGGPSVDSEEFFRRLLAEGGYTFRRAEGGFDADGFDADGFDADGFDADDTFREQRL